MKQTLKAVLLALLIFFLVAAALLFGVAIFFAAITPANPVVDSLPDYEEKEVWSSEGFQDFTTYAKYHYAAITPDALENSPYFQHVTEQDLPELSAYLQDFEGWVELDSTFPSEHYDFDKSLLQPGNFFYIESKYAGTHPEHGNSDKFWHYDVYYLDLGSGILYYFHNNI